MKRTTLVLSLAVSLIGLHESLAQVSQVWLARYDGPMPGEEVGKAIAVDSTGSVYIAGYTRSSSFGTGDYLVIKYRPNGDTAWVRTYNGPGNGEDEAVAIAVDRFGNAYVTGFSTGAGTGTDFATIKYNSNGVVQWVRRYDGPTQNADVAHALVLDANANVYITGESWGPTTLSDFLTVKYNTNGVEQWIRRDSCESTGNDYAYAIALSPDASRVCVTGTSLGGISAFDYYTSCYSTANGDTVLHRRYNGPQNATDEARAIGIDNLNNVYVTGFVNDGPSTDKDYATLKYTAVGAQQWVRFYDGSANANDIAEALTVDGAGNVFVTGSTVGDTTLFDITTIHYTTGGAEQWVRTFNGVGNSNDAAFAITLDAVRNVYVAGTGGNPAIAKFVTLRYNTNGVQQWVVLSDTTGRGRALRVDAAGSVYVTGNSEGTNPDCVTIKYAQTTGVRELDGRMARGFALYQNYPNPFNPTTTIQYDSPSAGLVSLKVFDILGREVRTLVNEVQDAGFKSVRFDASRLASGVYFYQLRAGDFTQTKKLLLLR